MKAFKNLGMRSLSVLIVLMMCMGLALPAFAATVEAAKTCTLEEHTHTDECYQTTGEVEKVLICEKQTEGHTHGDDCYAWSYELTCTEAETEADPQNTPHVHTDECYKEISLECPKEAHTHGDACYAMELTCTDESEDHQHTSACYTRGALTCTVEEHTHSAACQTGKKLTCTQSDLPEHKHTEACYTRVKGELTCTLEEDAQPHEHTDECYEEREVKELICDKQEHTHTAACFTNTTEDGKTLEQALKQALADAAGKTGEDAQVILILNGQTLNLNRGGTLEGIRVTNGQELTIQDGTVAGGTIKGDKNYIRLITVTNGIVNLSGSTVLTDGTGTGGGAVFVGSNGTMNMSGGTITGSTAIKGSNGGAVLVEGKFTMSGGTIDGNTAANGGGVAVGEGGQFTMTGGVISNNTAAGEGGGVYVDKGGKFTMQDAEDGTSGAISGNTASEGGGVFVDYDKNSKGEYKRGEFTMNGGAIDGNKATVGEGGGVYIQGKGDITKGSITNNVTYTHEDLGGGGIYIEADGVLTLKNAIITGNTANGMGGGIAACVHGKTYVYALEGAVITGNTALGQGHTEGYERSDGTYNGSFTDGYTYWATAEDVVKNAAQDIFAAGDAFEASLAKPGTATNSQGTAGIIVSNNLPGENGGTTNWSGYTFSYVTDENGNAVKDSNDNYIFELTEITENNNGVVYGNRLVFLTSDPDQESVQKAIAAMKNGVIISGNLSANSHGGGIANNGVLTIGEGPMTGTNSKTPEAELTKELESNDENVTIADKTFTFELRDKNGNLVEGGSVTNDETGKAVFSFPPEYFNDVKFPEGADEVEYVFYVSEKDDGQANVTYDGTQYKVIIRVTRTTETVKLGHDNVTLETLSIGEPEILVRVVDENGSESYEAADGIKFTNTYTKPTDPPGGGNTPGGDDPGDTPTPRDPNSPTEVEEPEVPLAERPEEPEKLEKPEDVEIEDPDIPLADIPQTGDIHLGWYGASILSALGLMMMALLGRKKSRES